MRSLNYYRTRVSKKISSYFDADFWGHTVLQMAEEEPALRHAVIALSSYYEAEELFPLSRTPSAVDRHYHLVRFAIRQHNNAISTLLNKAPTKGPLIGVVVMSCLIFAWLEFLQNNVEDALRHLRSGLRIMAEQRQTPEPQNVAMQVTHILGRVITQAMLHGCSAVELDYLTVIECSMGSQSSNPTTLMDLWRDLDWKINSAFRFLGQIRSSAYTGPHHGRSALADLESLRDEYEDQIRSLDRWKMAFEELRAQTLMEALTADAVKALHQLELCHLLISNTLETLFATTPMVYDKHNHTFGRMLYLSRQLLQDHVFHRSNSLFTMPFDCSIQGALFHIILRCRHLPIRREAIQLLQISPDHEGLWQRECLVAFCHWKINVEENGRPQWALETDPLPESARVYGEEARYLIKDAQAVVVVSYKKRVLMNSSGGVASDEEQDTNLSTRLVGLLESWRAWPLYPAIVPNDIFCL
jgi:hypothetical protein